MPSSSSSSSPRQSPGGPLVTTLLKTLQTRESKSNLRRLTTLPKSSTKTTDLSSNDFLSLSTSPTLRTHYLSLLTNYPQDHPFASGGSRLLDGNSEYAESLESLIATFHDAPAALLFNSGFDANAGVLACLPQPGDVLVYDEFVHASIHEGMRLSRAGERVGFRHCDVRSLEDVLVGVWGRDERVRNGGRNVFVVVESVYSMDGDVAPIGEMVGVVERVFGGCSGGKGSGSGKGKGKGNAYFFVDEAHATGVWGKRGVGVVQELGVQRDMFIRVHTFGKALASHGAAVLCCPITRDYLINYCRTVIYTTALGFPFLASIRASYDFLMEGHTEPLQQSLHNLTTHLHHLLTEVTKNTSPTSSGSESTLTIDHFPNSPIFSLRTPKPRELAAFCQQRGFVVRAIMSPTVPVGMERVRVCLHAGNTVEEVEGFVRVVGMWLGERARL